MQEQEQNRTEPASPFKLSEARKRGQVAKSLDFNSFLIVCGLLCGLSIWGRANWERICELCARLLASSARLQIDPESFPFIAASIARDGLVIVLPFAVAGMVFGITANVLQTGFILSADPIKPKFERLNPVAGFKRTYNKKMLFEAVKSVLKLIFFVCVAYTFFASLWPVFLSIGGASVEGQIQVFGSSALTLLFRLGLALVIVGLLDLAFQRWQFSRQMMMSRREMKEEVKRREGDPQIRAKIRELQRENLKQASSMSRVPDADVLITNPEHLAIALRYDRERMSAPIVIAKGADAWAAHMRGVAHRHSIPIFERRRLARLLYRRTQLNEQIPMESFVDVARIYADISRDRLNQLASGAVS